jgi:D-tyrosyl-tRNA(Tyr) deacylase
MRAIIQRVSQASVSIDGKVKSEIGIGFLVLLGIEGSDTQEDIDYLGKKITQLRVFNDHDGKMNLSLTDIGGDILLISQFTLYAQTQKGNRPSFIRAARPDIAVPLYEEFMRNLALLLQKTIYCGEFGADMKVSLLNDGPVTIVIDSRQRDF